MPAAPRAVRHPLSRNLLDLVGAKLAAEQVGRVLDLAARHHLDDVEQVELALRLLLAAHHQDVLEALVVFRAILGRAIARSEEHTSELQSLMRISYAVFCLKKKIKNTHNNNAYVSHNNN